MSANVSRFVERHAEDFTQALGEIEAGQKRSHWIWYVFPQIVELGRSETARHYGIRSVDEAQAFLGHPELGDNYRRIVHAVREQVVERHIPIRRLFGTPDDLKLVSSLTLFRGVADASADAALLDDIEAILVAADAEGLPRCATTTDFLGSATA